MLSLPTNKLSCSRKGMGLLSKRSRMVASFIAIALVVGLGIRVILALATGDGNLFHAAHWIVYGHDKVWYHNRAYLDPSHEFTAQALEMKYGQGQKFIPTGDKVMGLPVYDTPRSLAFQKQRHVVPTLLILCEQDGNFIVYDLSGGP